MSYPHLETAKPVRGNDMGTEIYTDVTQRDVLHAQLEFESQVWLGHKAVDERAEHMNQFALKYRADAMRRIDGLLDRLSALGPDNEL